MQTALDAIRSQYGEDNVRVVPDGQGGAWVEIADVPLGESFTQETTFVLFLLPFNLPNADVYPVFVRNGLERVDGSPHGQGFQSTSVSWPGETDTRSVTQLSRRTRGGHFARQTPVQKLEKVLTWLRSR